MLSSGQAPLTHALWGISLHADSRWLIDLDQEHSSYFVLGALVLIGLAAGGLFQSGIAGWTMRVVQIVMQGGIRKGFELWEVLLAWAAWPAFLLLACSFLALGWAVGAFLPAFKMVGGFVPLVMGTLACLAYMFIDQERYEVERGYKATHNPLKGQTLALHLPEYGHQVRVPLLMAATFAMVAGFALLNQGVYESVGEAWFRVGDTRGGPLYVDFVVYGLINLLGIVDVLNLANSSQVVRFAYVHPAAWPASTLLALFKMFFTVVLLRQIFASLRQGKLLAETIADFWSPHEPIHERARNALPQYGALAIGPLLVSLRSVESLTKEQRDRLPTIVATVGPSAIPTLIRHLQDSHEHVRAIAAASLGQLHAMDAVSLLAPLSRDDSDMVRISVVEALGMVRGGSVGKVQRIRRSRRRLGFPWKGQQPVAARRDDPIRIAVETLQGLLADRLPAVRTLAAVALGKLGSAAADVAPDLVRLLKDGDETVRCQAAESLGQVGVTEEAVVQALVELLGDASPAVKASAARALRALKTDAALAVPALVPLLQDRDTTVRTTAAEAIASAGPLDAEATSALVEGLVSPDTVVRAQTAEALGTIGGAAQDAAPALVKAIDDGNDRLRAKAVEALGKIGEGAADVAVPTLVRALRDQDNWVSALAAEALGEMGESADEAVPALVRSLKHVNPRVRANAAEALGKLGSATAAVRSGLEKAAGDEDGGVRSQALRALGGLGDPAPTTRQAVLGGLQDADPQVRAAAVETVGQWGDWGDAVRTRLLPLLEDANDEVKVQVIRVLPPLAGATPAVLEGLGRLLTDDDNGWVQMHAALALGRLGSAAAPMGAALLRAARTGEESVREQAMRAIALIQPPEISEAFAAGLKDSSAQIRKIASGGWIKAASIPETVIPALIEALDDPENQVRANAARVLARLESLPPDALAPLLNCAADANYSVRMNAAAALRRSTAPAVNQLMRQLVEDANLRIRLIAAGSILLADSSNTGAWAVVAEALNDSLPSVRKAGLDLLESQGIERTQLDKILSERLGQESLPVVQGVIPPVEQNAMQPPMSGIT